MGSHKLNPKCTVCGDEAAGFNYFTLSCKSCKIFFFRYHKSKTNLKCKHNDNCQIDCFTRNKCKKCRLEKCFVLGMRKTYTKPVKCENLSLRSLLSSGSKQNVDIEQEIIDISKDVFELSKHELDLIRKLQTSHDNAFEDERKLEYWGEQEEPNKFPWPDLYAKRIARFCKSLPAFRSFCSDDQLIILKEFVVEILTIRAVYLYDSETNGFLAIRDESGKQSMLVKLTEVEEKKTEEYHDNLKFALSLHKEIEKDCIIKDLIIAKQLFQLREHISCLEYISYQQSLYSHLLKRYLFHKYRSVQKAEDKFVALQNVLNFFDTLKENYRKMYNLEALARFSRLLGEALSQ